MENNMDFRSYEEIVNSLQQVGFTKVKAYEDGVFKTATPQANFFTFHCEK